MPNNKDIISRLDELNREELCILARKLGLIKPPDTASAFIMVVQDSYYKFFPRNEKLIGKIMSKTENRKTAEEFLEVHSRLTAMDLEQLENLVRKLGVKETDFYRKSDIVRHVLESAEIGDIRRGADSRRVLLNRGLFIIGAIIIFFLTLYLKEYNMSDVSLENVSNFLSELKKDVKENIFQRSFLIDKLIKQIIIGWLGSLASIIGFFLIFSPETELNWRKRIFICWTTNRLEFIWFLIFFMSYYYRDPIELFSYIAAPASIASVLLTFVDKQTLGYWEKKYFYMVYYGIIIILGSGLFYIINYTQLFEINGYVYKDGKPVSGTIAISEKQNFSARIKNGTFFNLPVPEDYEEKEEINFIIFVENGKDEKNEKFYHTSKKEGDKINVNIKDIGGIWKCWKEKQEYYALIEEDFIKLEKDGISTEKMKDLKDKKYTGNDGREEFVREIQTKWEENNKDQNDQNTLSLILKYAKKIEKEYKWEIKKTKENNELYIKIKECSERMYKNYSFEEKKFPYSYELRQFSSPQNEYPYFIANTEEGIKGTLHFNKRYSSVFHCIRISDIYK